MSRAHLAEHPIADPSKHILTYEEEILAPDEAVTLEADFVDAPDTYRDAPITAVQGKAIVHAERKPVRLDEPESGDWFSAARNGSVFGYSPSKRQLAAICRQPAWVSGLQCSQKSSPLVAMTRSWMTSSEPWRMYFVHVVTAGEGRAMSKRRLRALVW